MNVEYARVRKFNTEPLRGLKNDRFDLGSSQSLPEFYKSEIVKCIKGKDSFGKQCEGDLCVYTGSKIPPFGQKTWDEEALKIKVCKEDYNEEDYYLL